MPEHRFEIEERDGKTCVTAHGRTRAGLFTSMMHGVFAAMKPQHHETPQKNQHTFSIQAETTEALLTNLLNEAIMVATASSETCDELKLDLITDKKVEGHFVGCTVTHFDQPAMAASNRGLVVKKDEATGEWNATICLEE